VDDAPNCSLHRPTGPVPATEWRVSHAEVINMVNDDRAADHQQAADVHDEMPGGRSSRGPDTGPAQEPQGLVPPYDDLRGENSGEGAEGVRKAFDADNAGEPGPPPPVSDEERRGMSATDTNPEPPLGVGRSTGKRGEDLAPDRDDVGTKGEAERPVGRTPDDDIDETGGSRPVDPRSPDLQTGDQGG
jgi:hypothetical protein